MKQIIHDTHPGSDGRRINHYVYVNLFFLDLINPMERVGGWAQCVLDSCVVG